MKYLLIILVATMFMGCKKSHGDKTCWDCEVQRRDGTTYKDRTCTDNGAPPQYMDGLGNDLNSFCTRR